MALRRPAPPRLHAGRPGARPVVPAPAATAAPAPAPAPAAPPAPALHHPELAPTPTLRGPRTARRTLLLAGAAVAVGLPVTALAVRTTRASFTDVAAGDSRSEAMHWAHETAVQPALSESEYGPDQPVTRGDVAVALHRLAGAPTVDLEAVPALLTDLGEDPAEVTALLWLHGRGALWGDAELKVYPAEPATPRCAATMIASLLRPALAGVGVTWDASAEVSVPHSGEGLLDLDWLTRAGMAPESFSASSGTGAAGVSRADLAVSLHRADAVIADALA